VAGVEGLIHDHQLKSALATFCWIPPHIGIPLYDPVL
jgi:hypothetical protein